MGDDYGWWLKKERKAAGGQNSQGGRAKGKGWWSVGEVEKGFCRGSKEEIQGRCRWWKKKTYLKIQIIKQRIIK
jgi:hypothetical protein